MDALTRHTAGADLVEIPDVIDFEDREPALALLRAALDRCRQPLLVVRLTDPVVTVTALHVLSDAYDYAHDRGIVLRTRPDPAAAHIFRLVGLPHLLDPVRATA
ncbi:hypothetical protein SAMN05216251_12066 [Actinacidiphila alni]|uniref:STAS domain-containing protein n=1 Tax=Actinacidiphila alni TaxID=380248 RepID=A0A1I2JYC2_9ACTN|nr:hypothetical protein [Actinacidiphila alni]SFF58890.1 hypothetical protein SAMN05216251_12066 [Actinacidiphila alni]